MPLVNRAPIDASGNLLVTTATPTPAWPSLGGMTYDPVSGALAVIDAVPAANDPWVGGIRFTNVGQMYVWSAALPAGVEYVGGIPVTDDGRMVVNGAGGGGSVVVGGWPIGSGGGVPVSGLAAQPIFFAPLQSTLVPTVAGNPAFTFTRSTLAYALDQDNVLRQAISGEARFQGARRVRNCIVGSSENFTAWSVSGMTVTFGAVGPTGLLTANTVTSTVGFSLLYVSAGLAGDYGINSVWMRRRTGTGQVTLRSADNATAIDITSQLSATWQRFATPPALAPAGGFFTIAIQVAGDAVDAAWAQSERVSGAANQAPGEYVSVGVLAAPYHGAGVDGVKYFQTTNGNSLPVNLLLQSQTLDNASWAKQTVTVAADSATAPNGTLTADTVTATSSNSFLTQLVSVTAVPYTFSIYLKRLSGTGPISITDGSSTVNVASQINSSTWTRVSGVITPAFGNKSWGLKLDINTDAVYAWGAQLEPGSGPPSLYTPTTTTAFPATNVVTEATGAAIPQATLLGYVAEAAATNLAVQSQTFDNAAWGKSNITVAANTQTAPDGTLTADTLTGTVDAYTYITTSGAPIVSSGVVTASAYFKAGTATYGWISDSGANVRVMFNATTGAFAGWEGTPTTHVFTSQVLPNGWIRATLSWTAAVATQVQYGLTMVSTSGTDLNNGKTIHIWGAQVEQASDASSYIPTTTAAVTRNADQLSYNVVSNIDGALATTYAEVFTLASPPIHQVPIEMNAGNFYAQYFSSANRTLGNYSAAATPATANARNLGAINKSASAWSGATVSLCLNGGAIGAGAFTAYVTSGVFGVGGTVNAGAKIQGSIRNVKFYATRLTDAELQALTA